MTAQVGRTVQDFTVLKISSGAAMVDMKINSLGDLGLDYPETDMFAWSDALHGVLVGKPDFSLEFGGPVDNTATTGPSTILRALAGVMTALSFDVQVGVRHAWESGEQQFGCSAVVASNSGVMVTSYKESGGMYKAKLRMIAGSASATVPAWGVAAEAVPS
jgi:hypothetical protein